MSVHTILMFLKFGSEENITDLFTNGTLYLNTLQHFRTIEDAELRGDLYEGVSQIKNYPPGAFEIPAINFKGEYINIHLRSLAEQVFGNVYSLYCISSFAIPNPSEFSIDERLSGFGNYCLLVKDNVEFLDRIRRSLRKAKLKFHEGFVSYYDRYAINSEVTVFQKPREFAYQNEFRIYVETNTTQPIILRIGDLRNIAQMLPTTDVMTLKLLSDERIA